jgi:two-component system chemotaxis response regulator CheY
MAHRSAKVLLVDDSGVMRALLRTIINSSDFIVVGEAQNGIKALEVLGTLKPDLVCLDIEMPELSGLDTLLQLKSKYPGIGVVMVTSSTVAADVKQALASGADGYILKPFNAGKVIDTLTRAYQKIQALPK